MRAEVKIGLAVGLLVIGGGVIFLVSQSHKNKTKEAEVLPIDAPATAKGQKPGDTRQPATARPGAPTPGKPTPTGSSRWRRR